MSTPILYLDNNASTPIDPRVLDAMVDALRNVYANPSSTTHQPGREAAALVERARKQVAALINADPGEIVFTSGATESNNLAILGLAADAPKDAKILTSAIEHKSVLGPIEELGRRGHVTRILGVDRTGRLDLDQLETELKLSRTLLVSVQAANSEIGTCQDIPAIVELAHASGTAVHCDATQMVGKLPVDVLAWGVDFLSFNAHKMHGPKGIGALYVATGPRNWPLRPMMFGGGQEQGVRPGTLDAPSIVGFGVAAELAAQVDLYRIDLVRFVRNEMEHDLDCAGLARSNGNMVHRLPNCSSLTLATTEADAVLAASRDLALSMASACHGVGVEPSHVLSAIGLDAAAALRTLRVALPMTIDEQGLVVSIGHLQAAIASVQHAGAQG